MKHLCLSLSIIGLSACGVATAEQPFQAEFQAACESQSQSAPPGFTLTGEYTREKYCKCIFNTAMRGLTDDEKKVAAFYLLGQSGVKVDHRPEFKTMDPMAIGNGAAAVGRAAQRCG